MVLFAQKRVSRATYTAQETLPLKSSFIHFFEIITIKLLLLGQFVFLTADTTDLEIRFAGEFNHVPIGCRTVAMGNTGVVLPYSDLCSFWNPSLIALSESYQVSIEGAKLYANLSSLGTIACSAPIQNGLSAGLTYSAFFPDHINEWDSLPLSYEEMKYVHSSYDFSPRGVFHNNKHRVSATVAKNFSIPIPRPTSYALPLPLDIAIGLNIKALWETMTPGEKVRLGYNINCDAGVVVRMGVDYDLDKGSIRREVLVAFSLVDFLPTKMIWLHSYEDYEEPVHGSQYYGLSYIDRSGFLYGNWTLSLSLHKLYEVSLHAGLEGEFFDMVSFRCGVSNKIVTLGAGVHYSRYYLDYSFSFDEIDYSFLRLAVGVRF